LEQTPAPELFPVTVRVKPVVQKFLTAMDKVFAIDELRDAWRAALDIIATETRDMGLFRISVTPLKAPAPEQSLAQNGLSDEQKQKMLSHWEKSPAAQ
jgi:hypothetical protein